MLDKANTGVPVHPGPSLLQYLVANVRMQLLFMYVPVLAILLCATWSRSGCTSQKWREALCRT